MSRLLWLVVWFSFIGYALWLAPGARSGDDPLFMDLVTLQSNEASLMAMFSLLGLFPVAFACLLLRSDNGNVPAWPFSLAAFGLGAFALIPYYILKRDQDLTYRQSRAPHWVLKLARSGVFLVLLMLGTLAVIGYGLFMGDLQAYGEAFSSSQFVHVMSIDFIILVLLSVYGIYRDPKRQPYSAMIACLGMLPIVGLLIYLWLTRHRVNTA
ncbi:hypothetical protein [Paenibacillus lemnae]|uniref:DUF2834 domain-containing protein n=1 Tax=Paenibacillus lemnae TaxID=1330551 RepID=A0A848MA98_PAELE|nr:hypothetical protein [Paenibacillus lemnae]NMO97595.1 hypothetical protein [Paenibacillus lemnae]